ncbi:alcohol oxidase [Aspergillus ambiguus]|uniref:GMC family oxidoreductase n=1 Tax=Aspergillus ambiguus TaxID=176160 RepID=UPI003CCE124E
MFGKLSFLSALSLAATGPWSNSISTKYDYIVVGGGTSGLAVANRLSEDLNVNVLIIEAGDSVLNNPNVTNVDGFGYAFGTDIDWQYKSTNQTYGGNLSQVLRAGKALGGTSAINGMCYTRAEDVQIDAWEAIGNEGWTWENLFPYYLKSENFTVPSKSQASLGASYNASFHGHDGIVDIAFTHIKSNNLTTYLNQTYRGMGLSWAEDVNSGKMRGFSMFPSTINYEEYVREDAARAYYWPYKSRGSLHVLLNTFANRILWTRESRDDHVTASGVEITSSNGTVSVIDVQKEVIISAGALKTPGILELSGIGNPSVLAKHNISVQVDLPTVGENLQDQVNSHMEAMSNVSISGGTTVAYPDVYDIFGDETESVAQKIRENLKQYAAETAKVNGDVMKASDLEHLFEVQHDLIFKGKVPIAEVLNYPGSEKSVSAEFWALLPFARGSVHISSANPREFPVINPNYFMFDWDLQSYVAVAKYIRRAFETYPLASIVRESSPGYDVVSQNASEESWKNWAFDGNYRSNFHPVGTAGMMPRALGGVVNEHLTVYGTTNVRVVDASALPFQISGHLVSTLYALAERAADFIKTDAARF